MANSTITKNAIADTMIQLSETKPIDKITIAEIVAGCGINRQTYYYHFEDKYQLIRWIYQTRIFDELLNGLTFDNWEEKMIKALIGLQKIRKFTLNVASSSNNCFQPYMQEILNEIFILAIEEIKGSVKETTLTDSDEKLYASFLTYGISGVILDWITMEDRITEIELVNKIKEMFIRTEKIDINSLL